MIEHRPMTETATVTMPLKEYDTMKMDSLRYRTIISTLLEHASYNEKEDDLYFFPFAEEYVRAIIKSFEPERYVVYKEEMKQKHEDQEQEDF